MMLTFVAGPTLQDRKAFDPALSRGGDEPSYPDFSLGTTSRLLRLEGALLEAIRSSEIRPTADAIRQAAVFVDLLPSTVPDPDFAVEEDGQMGFDWRIGNRMLSINVGRDQMIGYSALFGLESAYGRVPFAEEIPARVASFLEGLDK